MPSPYRMVTIFRGFKFSFLEGKSLVWKFSWYLFSLHALSFASDRIASYPAVAVVSLLFSIRLQRCEGYLGGLLEAK